MFDDALAAMALHAAGYTLPAIVAPWLLDAQCPDGGWAYDAPYDPNRRRRALSQRAERLFDSDSNTSGYVVMSLEAITTPPWSSDPFAFFDTVRDPAHGGWSYSSAFLATDANSTALVIQAYASAGVPLPHGGLGALRDLQYQKCGAWAYTWNGNAIGDPDVGATIAAIPAILLDALPIPPGHRSPRTCRTCPPAPEVLTRRCSVDGSDRRDRTGFRHRADRAGPGRRGHRRGERLRGACGRAARGPRRRTRATGRRPIASRSTPST